jgi:cytochrome c oxidase subunit III
MTEPYPRRNFIIHPAGMIIVLIFFGISTLFGALSLAYLYTRVDRNMNSIHIPVLFVFNTLVLAFSSYSIQRCRKYFDLQDDTRCVQWGIITMTATLAFLGLQGVAWYQLFSQSILPASSGAYGYLYAISILHFLHVFAGMPFLGRVIFPLITASKQGNSALIFIDDDQKRMLKHTAWYWHFIDVVWIYLIVFFLVNSIFL